MTYNLFQGWSSFRSAHDIYMLPSSYAYPLLMRTVAFVKSVCRGGAVPLGFSFHVHGFSKMLFFGTRLEEHPTPTSKQALLRLIYCLLSQLHVQ